MTMNLNNKLTDQTFSYEKLERVKYRLLRTYYQMTRDVLGIFSKINKNDKNIMAFKDKYIGNRCFIIGNGPSLEIKDLQKLHELGEYTFAFNKIYLAFEATKFRPTFYAIEDRLVANNVKMEVEKLENIYKFFPYEYKGLFGKLPNTCFYYMENRLKKSITFPSFDPDPFHICLGETVTYSALQLAVFMGFNPIILLGIDFSFTIPKNMPRNTNMVYDNGKVNHFHPDYRSKNEKWYAPDMRFQEMAYLQAHRYSITHDVKIYNATRGGKLDVFERVGLDRLLNDSENISNHLNI